MNENNYLLADHSTIETNKMVIINHCPLQGWRDYEDKTP